MIQFFFSINIYIIEFLIEIIILSTLFHYTELARWHTIDLFIFKELIFGVNEDNVCWVQKIQRHLQWNSQQKESIFSSVGLERANKHFYRYFETIFRWWPVPMQCVGTVVLGFGFFFGVFFLFLFIFLLFYFVLATTAKLLLYMYM